jgi:hypothetical protein
VALFALAGLGGAAVGLARGGRLHQLLGLHLRAGPLAWACFAAQVALGLAEHGPPPLVRDVVLVASYAGIGLWIAVNVAGRGTGSGVGFALLLAGWLLNVVPMVLNDGMPVSANAQRAVGAGDEVVDEGHLWKHVPATGDTGAAWLGDVIPLRPVRAVVSVGDLFLLAGVGTVVAAALRERT